MRRGKISAMGFGAALLGILIFATSCGRPAGAVAFDKKRAKDVTLQQLEQETKDLPYFLYWGREKGFHYFGRKDGVVYRLPESVWELPPDRGWRLGTAALYITLHDGKFRPPSALKKE